MVVRRSVVVTEDPAAPPAKPEKIRCRSCGVGLPKGLMVFKLDREGAQPERLMARARTFVCSYCRRDPNWGKDGYFRDIIHEEFHDPKTSQDRKDLLYSILIGRNAAERRHLARKAFP